MKKEHSSMLAIALGLGMFGAFLLVREEERTGQPIRVQTPPSEVRVRLVNRSGSALVTVPAENLAKAKADGYRAVSDAENAIIDTLAAARPETIGEVVSRLGAPAYCDTRKCYWRIEQAQRAPSFICATFSSSSNPPLDSDEVDEVAFSFNRCGSMAPVRRE